MNITFLFRASLSVFIFHRLLSSYLIYQYSRRNKFLAFLQLLDLSFLKTLQINYQFQNEVPCSPQTYLTNIEAQFESYPQFLIQSYFLVTLNATKSDNFQIDWIFAVSIGMSLFSIVSKKWTQDKGLVKAEWQAMRFNWKRITTSLSINIRDCCNCYTCKDCLYSCRNTFSLLFTSLMKQQKAANEIVQVSFHIYNFVFVYFCDREREREVDNICSCVSQFCQDFPNVVCILNSLELWFR